MSAPAWRRSRGLLSLRGNPKTGPSISPIPESQCSPEGKGSGGRGGEREVEGEGEGEEGIEEVSKRNRMRIGGKMRACS